MEKELDNKYVRFIDLKNEVQVAKEEKNKFGNFNYRTVEQIFKAIKPLEKKYNILIDINSDLEVINERLFHVATAKAFDIVSGETITTKRSYAEFQNKAGTKMNESQLSGSVESYAVKRALQMLVGLDDGNDSDSESASVVLKEKPLTPRVVTKKEEIVLEDRTFGKKVETPKEPKEIEEQPIENKLYELKQKTLSATKPEDIENLKKELEELGGDKNTLAIIEAKGREINTKSGGTKLILNTK